MKKVKFLLTGESVTTTGKEKWTNGCGQTEVTYQNGNIGWEFSSDLYDNPDGKHLWEIPFFSLKQTKL